MTGFWPKMAVLGQNMGRGGTMLTSRNSFLLLRVCYLCATVGENRSRNATARVQTDRQTDRQTDAATDTN